MLHVKLELSNMMIWWPSIIHKFDAYTISVLNYNAMQLILQILTKFHEWTYFELLPSCPHLGFPISLEQHFLPIYCISSVIFNGILSLSDEIWQVYFGLKRLSLFTCVCQVLILKVDDRCGHEFLMSSFEDTNGGA